MPARWRSIRHAQDATEQERCRRSKVMSFEETQRQAGVANAGRRQLTP